jgi:hypothetical protein
MRSASWDCVICREFRSSQIAKLISIQSPFSGAPYRFRTFLQMELTARLADCSNPRALNAKNRAGHENFGGHQIELQL